MAESSDDSVADLQRRSPTGSSSPPANGGATVISGVGPGSADTDEDNGPVIRMAASRARRPVAETTGHGNTLVVDTRAWFAGLLGRKLSRTINFGTIWLVKDYCGLYCCFMTLSLIAYAEFVIWFIIVPSHAISYLNLAVWQCWASLALFSHWRTMMSDPGAIPIGNCTMDNLRRLGYGAQNNNQDMAVTGDANYRQQQQQQQQQPTIVYKCPRCACIKPDKSHHCSICKRCIFKMDHHCPWVNNCVGMLNQKYFILFCLYIAIMSAHGIVIDLQFLFTCFAYIDPHAAQRLDNDGDVQMCLRPPRPGTQDVVHLISLSGGIIFVIFMLFEAVIFSLFTAIMCGTQLHAVCTETSTVDQIKKQDAEMGQMQSSEGGGARKRRSSGSKSEKNGCLAPLGETFGDRKPPNIRWLSPFHDHALRRPGFMQPPYDEASSRSLLSAVRTA